MNNNRRIASISFALNEHGLIDAIVDHKNKTLTLQFPAASHSKNFLKELRDTVGPDLFEAAIGKIDDLAIMNCLRESRSEAITRIADEHYSDAVAE